VFLSRLIQLCDQQIDAVIVGEVGARASCGEIGRYE
jgi:hypothetical protein